MSEVYKYFSHEYTDFDFSEEMRLELQNHESLGNKVCPLSPKNGFALGKKWLNINVAMWIEGIEEGTFFKYEFYKNPNYPHWWLDSIFENVTQGCGAIRDYYSGGYRGHRENEEVVGSRGSDSPREDQSVGGDDVCS